MMALGDVCSKKDGELRIVERVSRSLAAVSLTRKTGFLIIRPLIGMSSDVPAASTLSSRGSAKRKPEELIEFRKMLKLLQARLRGDVEQLQEEAFSGSEAGNESRSSNHMAEMGSDAWDLDFALQLVESDQGVLEEISHALKKFDNGTYGLCETSMEQGKPEAKARIPKVRLQAIPHARNCIECERIKEKGR
jgi:DnaK suppressor protein